MRPAGLMLAAATVLMTAGPAGAFFVDGYRQGPWCAGQSIGWTWVENCTMPSLEICRQEVIAGNRGVCFPNPNWIAQSPAPRAKRKKPRR